MYIVNGHIYTMQFIVIGDIHCLEHLPVFQYFSSTDLTNINCKPPAINHNFFMNQHKCTSMSRIFVGYYDLSTSRLGQLISGPRSVKCGYNLHH